MEAVESSAMIPILGMHRSGTSALAGALHKLGGDLGPESSWVRPAIDNPLGFFEYVPVLDLNRDLLLQLGGSWSSPPPLPPGWIDDPRLSEVRVRAERLASEIPASMIVKDPRLSLTQPFWDACSSSISTSSIHCVRHPTAVARSLQERNSFSVDHGLFLWFRYTAAALHYRPNAIVVEYEQLLSDPVAELGHLVSYLGLMASEAVLDQAAGTVYRDMAHHLDTPLPDSPIGSVCRELYDLVRSDSRPDEHPAITWASLVSELPWAGPGDRDIRRAMAAVDEAKAETAQLAADNARLGQRSERLERELRLALDAVDRSVVAGSADLLSLLGHDPT